MDMLDDVVLIWNCTSCRVVYQEEFVLIVVMRPLVDIVITVKKDSIEIQLNK